MRGTEPLQFTLFPEASAAPPSPAAAGPQAAAPGVAPAAREVQLGEHRVAYVLRRARRRTIGFAVGADGLTVSAPRWLALADVEGVLREKGAWILRKLHEQRERTRRLQAARIDWRDGATLPFLGQPVTVRIDPLTTGAVLQAGSAPGSARTLHVGLANDAAPAQLRDAVQSWLQRQARRILEERCAHFAPRLGVRMKRMALSAATTRWGSASADGSIRLHWRLVHFAPAVIDYVVVHELAHLREMHHGPAFWDVVRSVVPDYEQARGALRDPLLPDLG